MALMMQLQYNVIFVYYTLNADKKSIRFRLVVLADSAITFSHMAAKEAEVKLTPRGEASCRKPCLESTSMPGVSLPQRKEHVMCLS